MRKLILFAAGIAVLATAGLAVAHTLGPPSSTAVTGTFAATTATKVTTRTCTTSDNRTITVSQGTYTGAATGVPDLTGPITLSARVTVDSTAGVGVASGHLHIASAGHDTLGLFTAVYDHGKIAGLVAGGAHTPTARLLGNLSAGFTAAGGFTDGKIGNSAGGSAIELAQTRCAHVKGTKEESSAHGTVTALGSSITVAALTCDIPADMSAKVNGALKVGDRAEIHCRLADGHNTLTAFKKKK